jgi:ubiquitin carboxyl-terminal hydrolase 36/42
MNIHPTIRNKCILFCELTEASALPVARRITDLSPNFLPGQQEDPSEFFVALFNHLMECASSNHFQSFSTYLCSPFHSIFGVNMKSSVRCSVCLNETVKENFESIWSIPIMSHSNLEKALKAFCSDEKLTGDNSFECSNCERKTSALKLLQLADLSPIIIIHLKRFVYDQCEKITRKLKDSISYPEFLDVMPYIDRNMFQSNQASRQSNQLVYRLYSVLVHLGETADNGHIFSYILSPDDAWYKMDDEIITPVSLETVLSDKNAYIICYSKLSNDKIHLYEEGMNRSSAQSSVIFSSSTPKHPNTITSETFDDHSPVRKLFYFQK